MTRRTWGALLLAFAVSAGASTPATAAIASGQGAPPAPADKPAQEAPVGSPKPGQVTRDAEFGVVTRQFGLERTVEMYQWHRAGQGYFAGWSLEPVDSTGFAPGHANPGAFPLQSRQWRALRVTLDGKPLAGSAVARFGEWRSFRPNFSALPGNLSATFQPEGDGLGSAENPLDPQVGDLRVTWRELVLPPLQGRVLLRDGEWVLPDSPEVTAPALDEVDPSSEAVAPAAGRWLAAGALLLVFAAALAYRRRTRRRSTSQQSSKPAE